MGRTRRGRRRRGGRRAARLYRLALELAADDASYRAAVLPRLGDALANAGRGAEAAAVYRDAAAHAGTTAALELDRRAARQLLISGHVDDGLAVLRSVLRRVEMDLPTTPRRALVSLAVRRAQLRLRGLGFTHRDVHEVSPSELVRIDVCWSVAQGLALVDTVRGADFQTRHLRLALAAGEATRVARALAVEAAYRAAAGAAARDRCEALLDRAATLAADAADPQVLALIRLYRGICLCLQGQWKASRAMHEEAERMLVDRCTGVAWELDTARFFWLLDAYYLGDLEGLRRRQPALVQDAQRRGDLYAEAALRLRHAWVLALAADDPDLAMRHVDESRDRWSHSAFHLQHWWGLQAAGEVRLYAGRPEEVLTELERRWSALTRSMYLRVQQVYVEAWSLRGRAAIAAVDGAGAKRDRRLDLALHAARRLRSVGAGYARGLAAMLEAGVATRRGDAAGARTAGREAETELAAADMAMHALAARHLTNDGDLGALGALGVRAPARWAAMLAPGR